MYLIHQHPLSLQREEFEWITSVTLDTTKVDRYVREHMPKGKGLPDSLLHRAWILDALGPNNDIEAAFLAMSHLSPFEANGMIRYGDIWFYVLSYVTEQDVHIGDALCEDLTRLLGRDIQAWDINSSLDDDLELFTAVMLRLSWSDDTMFEYYLSGTSEHRPPRDVCHQWRATLGRLS